MIPIKPLSEHRDAQSKHVAGSQKAADEKLARNLRRASKPRNIHIILTGATLEVIVIACMATMIVAGVIAVWR